jgi:hypothetical protein
MDALLINIDRVESPVMSKDHKPLIGTWNILSMSEWTDEVIHAAGPAQIVIQPDWSGEMRFCYVDLSFNCDLVESAAENEFSFIGADEMERVSGRGRMKLKKDSKLHGRIWFHHGDSSTFVATR